MNTYQQLPTNYEEIFSIDLQNDKKALFIVNGLSFLLIFVMIIFTILLSKFTDLIPKRDASIGSTFYIIRLLISIFCIFIYLCLHELTHGLTMKYFGAKRIKYGFTGIYAFAGTDEYFSKKAYITIALSPVVIWTIILTIINFFIPNLWFYCVFFVQVINISGSAGDIYISYLFSKLPKEVLIQDAGVSMKVFLNKEIDKK